MKIPYCTSHRVLVFAAVLLLCLVAGGNSAAQSSSPPQASTPAASAPAASSPAPPGPALQTSTAVIHSETRLVLVDTVVTDKKGNYVRDLTQKDFKFSRTTKNNRWSVSPPVPTRLSRPTASAAT